MNCGSCIFGLLCQRKHKVRCKDLVQFWYNVSHSQEKTEVYGCYIRFLNLDHVSLFHTEKEVVWTWPQDFTMLHSSQDIGDFRNHYCYTFREKGIAQSGKYFCWKAQGKDSEGKKLLKLISREGSRKLPN